MRCAMMTALALLLLGCGHHHGGHAKCGLSATAARANGDLWIGLVTHDARGPKQNALDSHLHTGDEVRLVVQVTSPRYLYVVNISPDGEPHLLAPLTTPEPSEGTVTIPPKGWFELAKPEGLELLALVASRERIVLDEAGLSHIMSLIRRTQQRHDLAKLQAARPPGFSSAGYASMGIRAEALALDRGAVRIHGAKDEVVVLMDLDHRPR